MSKEQPIMSKFMNVSAKNTGKSILNVFTVKVDLSIVTWQISLYFLHFAYFLDFIASKICLYTISSDSEQPIDNTGDVSKDGSGDEEDLNHQQDLSGQPGQQPNDTNPLVQDAESQDNDFTQSEFGTQLEAGTNSEATQATTPVASLNFLNLTQEEIMRLNVVLMQGTSIN